MKRKLLSLLLALAMCLALVSCGATGEPQTAAAPAASVSEPADAAEPVEEVAAEPADLTGEWESMENVTPGASQEAKITSDTITIYWESDEDGEEYLYWAGTFAAPSTADEPYSWASENDHNQTDSALLASGDDTKTFTYQDGKITYDVVVQDEIYSVTLTKTGELDADEGGAEAGEAFADNVLTLDDYTIEVTDCKILQDGEDSNDYNEGPVIVFTYNVTNIDEDDLDPVTAWILNFTAIQDNDPNSVNELEIASTPENYMRDTDWEIIKEGGSVTASVAYLLDDLETPVTLKAEDGMGTEYGEQTFDVK